MAVGQGFEPRVRYKRTAVFKTAALSHSASPPFFHDRHFDSGVNDTGIACAVNALQEFDSGSGLRDKDKLKLMVFNGIFVQY